MKSENTTIEKDILDTAERLFLDKGFALTSTTEIAREVGCNQAMVHYYFRTKENLFQQIFERKARLFASVFVNMTTTGASFEELLRQGIETHFDLLLNNPKLPFLLINEITTNPKRIDSLAQKVGNIPVGILQTLQIMIDNESKEGKIRPVNAIDLFITIVSMNAAVFLGLPVISQVMPMSENVLNDFLHRRKKEICDTILLSLRPLN